MISKIHKNDHPFVQLCDSALSKDFFPDDYHHCPDDDRHHCPDDDRHHCPDDNVERPLKWMAYESLINHSFNHSTDVVSSSIFLFLPFNLLPFFFHKLKQKKKIRKISKMKF